MLYQRLQRNRTLVSLWTHQILKNLNLSQQLKNIKFKYWYHDGKYNEHCMIITKRTKWTTIYLVFRNDRIRTIDSHQIQKKSKTLSRLSCWIECAQLNLLIFQIVSACFLYISIASSLIIVNLQIFPFYIVCIFSKLCMCVYHYYHRYFFFYCRKN